jgi:hypothetical protein
MKSKIEVIEFDNTDERDEWLDKFYPDREAQEECGLYNIYEGTILVRLNIVEVNRKFK